MKIYYVSVLIVLLIKNYCLSILVQHENAQLYPNLSKTVDSIATMTAIKKQFRQDEYEIEHDRIDIYKVNKSACVDPTATVFKYNDTLKMKALNLSATFTPGVKKNILLNAAVYRLVKGKYRLFPFPNVTIDLCDEFKRLGEKNPFGIRNAIMQSNFRGCPCPVGFYYLFNWILEDDKFPPHIPAGVYKLRLHIKIDDNTFLFSGAWFGAVVNKKKG